MAISQELIKAVKDQQGDIAPYFEHISQEDAVLLKDKLELRKLSGTHGFLKKVEDRAYLNLIRHPNHNREQSIQQLKNRVFSEGLEILKYHVEKQGMIKGFIGQC